MERIGNPVTMNEATPDLGSSSILLFPQHLKTYSKASDLVLLTTEGLAQVSQNLVLRLDFCSCK